MLSTKLIPSAAAVAGIAALSLWLTGKAVRPVEKRLPGADGGPGQASAAAVRGGPSTRGGPLASQPQAADLALPQLRGTLVRFDGKPADLPGAWPRFRGPNLDNVSDEDVRLLRSFPEPPPLLWAIDVGEGYAGAAVRNGRVYLLDYDRQQQSDALRCLSLADGKEIWRFSYPVAVKRNHGMSRTVPTVIDKYVVTLGPKCHVTCLDAATGELRWAIDLVAEYGTKVPLWYAGQCPLIDGGRVILGVGGPEVLMMAVDCETGKVAWKTPNPHGWQMTHSSVMPMEFAGKRMYVYSASSSSDDGGVVGVSAEDGRILWISQDWTIRIIVPSPLIVGEGRIFLTGGYNTDSAMLQLTQEADKLTARTLFRLKPQVFAAEQQTPILYQGHLYGVRIDDHQLVCLDLNGNVVWASGPEHAFGPRGLGSFLIADGMILILNDEGVLSLVGASPGGFNRLAQAKVLEGHECWGPMALVGGRLIARDLTRMVCLDLRAR